MKTYIIIPDVHVPFHDKKAWKLLLKTIDTVQPYGVVILGDFADFYSVSSHSKDPNRAHDLGWEVQEVNKALRQLDAFKCLKDKRFIQGNHCQRLERYLMDKAPALFNTIKTEQLFKLKENGWKYTPYKSHTKVGKVFFTHDVGASGKTAHFKALEAFQSNVVTGHNHRLNYTIEGNAQGKPHVSATFGWLGNVREIDYMARINALRAWALAFGMGYLLPNGYMHLVPIPIIDYSVVVEGKLIK